MDNGAYQIISAESTSYGLSVKGAASAKGANVWLEAAKNSPGQKWYVTDYGDSGAQIACALSGRCLDIAGNKMAQGTNIRQWTDINSQGQRFVIEADGNTATIGSTTYNTYIIKAAKDSGYCVDAKSKAASGVNIVLNAVDGTAGQRWVFKPIDILYELGTYEIANASDEDIRAGVSHSSTAKGHNLDVHSRTGSKGEKFYTRMNDDGTVQLINAGSGYAVAAKTVASGSVIYQWPYSAGAEAQSWFLEHVGSMAIEGAAYPTYKVYCQAGEGSSPYCMDGDLVKGKYKDATLRLMQYDGSLDQKWAFVPTSAPLTSGIPVPANLSYSEPAENGADSVTISFDCNWLDFQIRTKYRKRLPATSALYKWTDWTPWCSAADGIPGNYGWGDEWTADVSYDAGTADHKTYTIAIPDDYIVDGANAVETEISVEVRCWASGWQGHEGLYVHGYQAAMDIDVRYMPTLTISGATLSGEGLTVAYTSDYLDGGCEVTVGTDTASETYTGKGLYGGSGSVTIPAKLFTDIPSGDITVTAELVRGQITASSSASVTVADADGRLTPDIEDKDSGYGTHILTVPVSSKSDTVEAYAIAEKPVDTYIKSRTDSAVTIESQAPLTEAFKICVWAVTGSGWIAKAVELAAVKTHTFTWIFDGGACVLDFAVGSFPEQTDTIAREATDYDVLGREYHAYRLKRSKTRDLSVSGAVVTDMEGHGKWDDFDALLNAGHAVFRNQRGEVIPVVVTQVSRPMQHPKYTEISVTQYQETR